MGIVQPRQEEMVGTIILRALPSLFRFPGEFHLAQKELRTAFLRETRCAKLAD